MNEKFDNMKEDNKQTNDSLRQQTKEDNRQMNENLENKIEKINEKIYSTNESIKRELRELINEKIEDVRKTLSQRMEVHKDENLEQQKLSINNRSKTKAEEITNNNNMEQLNPEIEEDSRKGIENKEDSSVLFSENINNKNKEKIKHIETNSRDVKKDQIIKKIKKTKDIGKIYKKKLVKTREEVEMMKQGLINELNL